MFLNAVGWGGDVLSAFEQHEDAMRRAGLGGAPNYDAYFGLFRTSLARQDSAAMDMRYYAQHAALREASEKLEAERRKKHGTYKPGDPFSNKVGVANLAKGLGWFNVKEG